MRNLNIIILFVALLLAGGAVAQDMRALFLDAPDSIMPLLTPNNRADCVDFLDAGMRARVTNRFEGHSELLAISRDYMELRSSESSAMQMKLLPFKGDTIIAVVRSVCAESCDSRITFYNCDWTMAGISFSRPSIEEFFAVPDSAGHLIDRCDIYLVQLRLSPADNSLQAEYTMPRYMNKADSALVAPRLRTLRYRWESGAFVRE